MLLPSYGLGITKTSIDPLSHSNGNNSIVPIKQYVIYNIKRSILCTVYMYANRYKAINYALRLEIILPTNKYSAAGACYLLSAT